jgi:hypothetical protein
MVLLNRDTMCCIYGKVPFGVGVFKEVWTLGDLIKVLDHYNVNHPSEGEVKPLGISEGGVEWPGTVASSAQWHTDTNDTDPGDRIITRQLRIVRGDNPKWPWIPSTPTSSWDQAFLDTVIARGVLEFRAKCSPSVGMFADLIASFRACSCPLVYTGGVAYDEFGHFRNTKGASGTSRSPQTRGAARRQHENNTRANSLCVVSSTTFEIALFEIGLAITSTRHPWRGC